MANYRAPWQLRYGIVRTASITATNAFATVTDIGIATGVFGVPLTNKPFIDPGQNIIDTRKAVGVATRRVGTVSNDFEFQQGIRDPKVSFEFDANAYNLGLPLWMLFQKGAAEVLVTTTTPNVKTYNAPTYSEGAECETFANLLVNTDAGGESQRMYGAVVDSIALSGDINTPLKATVSFIGREIDPDFNADTATISFYDKAPLMWTGTSGPTITLGGTSIEAASFNVTINNNASPRHYNNQLASRYILGDFTAEGSIKFPWGTATLGAHQAIQDFIDGTDKELIIYWGSATGATTGDFAIKLNVRYNGITLDPAEEIMVEIPFIAVYDGTNEAMEVVLNDSIVRGIP